MALASHTHAEDLIGKTTQDLKNLNFKMNWGSSWDQSSGLWLEFWTRNNQSYLALLNSENKVGKVMKVVDFLKVDLMGDEEISGSEVHCRWNEIKAISVFKRKTAKETGTFPAERSWIVDHSKFRLVQKSESVNCSWYPNGDGEFPYKD